MPEDLTRVTRAFDFACRAHAKQRRKGAGQEPYVNHLAEVADLVAQATGGSDPDLVIAALLHDTVEDQDVKREEIAALFGEDVARIVMEVTDDKTLEKDVRKRMQVEHAAHISKQARILKIADKTSNLRSIQYSPPPWPESRKRRYFAWAQAVVSQARGVNPWIEAAFDKEYEEALAQGLAQRDFVWRQELETEGDD
ncbi:MAG: metal dependent phosphohydrolase [Betaproteobacteria bacterium]|nr:metal dependent phosphohydrolase [Betaproteobacteria bacterium]